MATGSSTACHTLQDNSQLVTSLWQMLYNIWYGKGSTRIYYIIIIPNGRSSMQASLQLATIIPYLVVPNIINHKWGCMNCMVALLLYQLTASSSFTWSICARAEILKHKEDFHWSVTIRYTIKAMPNTDITIKQIGIAWFQQWEQ